MVVLLGLFHLLFYHPYSGGFVPVVQLENLMTLQSISDKHSDERHN